MSASNHEPRPDDNSPTLHDEVGKSGNTDNLEGIRELLAMIERAAYAPPATASFPLFTHRKDEPPGSGSETRARISRSSQGAVQLVAPLPVVPLRLGAVVPRDQLSPFERPTAVGFNRKATAIPALLPISRTIKLWQLAAAAAALGATVGGSLALWVHNRDPAEQVSQRAPTPVRDADVPVAKETRRPETARASPSGSASEPNRARHNDPDDLDVTGGPQLAVAASHVAIGIRIRSRTGVLNYPEMRIDKALVSDASFEFLRLRNLPVDARVSQGLNTSPGIWVLAKSQLPMLVIWLQQPVLDDTAIILDLLRIDGSIIASRQHQLAMTVPGDQAPRARP